MVRTVYSIVTMDHPVVRLTLVESGVNVIFAKKRIDFLFLFFKVFFIALRERDVVFNFQYPNSRYLPSVLLLKLLGYKYTVSLWGSDYLKVSGIKETILRFILSGARKVSLASRDSMQVLAKKYKLPESIFFVSPFLIPNIEELYNFRNSENSFQDGKKVKILCGTNGSPNQQFDKIIAALKFIEDKAFGVIDVEFHIAYGLTEEIEKLIKKFSESTGYNVIINKKFMSGDELINYRKRFDILIQIQKTDQLSAAMLEHLVQDKIVITGDWLNYAVLDDVGINYIKIPKVGIERALSSVILEIINGVKWVRVEGNGAKIIKHFGKANKINKWKDFFLCEK